MLKSEPPSVTTTRCPSCGHTLEGEFEEASVSLEDDRMSVSVVCEECDADVDLSVSPVPPEGRKVDVVLEAGR